jgi:hypothetical protein
VLFNQNGKSLVYEDDESKDDEEEEQEVWV